MRRSRRAAHGTMPAERDVVLVRAIGSDGAEGWGECSALEAPTYTGEHTAAAWAVLRDLVVPLALAGGRNRGIGHPMASAAVDIAVTDLSLRRQGITLAGALGRDDPQAPGSGVDGGGGRAADASTTSSPRSTTRPRPWRGAA